MEAVGGFDMGWKRVMPRRVGRYNNNNNEQK